MKNLINIFPGIFRILFQLVEQYHPAKLVFDELTPFVNYEDAE
jgi:hypothetical protein